MSNRTQRRLTWHEDAENRWRAEGNGRRYIISEDDGGRFTLEFEDTDLGPVEIGEFPTIGRAQVAAHAHFAGDAEHANSLADPYLTRLKAAHPERLPA